MIVTRTPLRVSFVGGGTDLPAFYEQEGGRVLSTAIDHYVWVTVKRHNELFFEPIRINYSTSEQVDRIEEHPEQHRARDVFASSTSSRRSTSHRRRRSGVNRSRRLERVHASAYSTLCTAIAGERVSAGQLAEEASYIEIDVLEATDRKAGPVRGSVRRPEHLPLPAGRQRQRRAAATPRTGRSTCSSKHLLMFWSGHQRNANDVLAEQNANTATNVELLRRMRDQVERAPEHAHDRPARLRRVRTHAARGLAR